ncbi:MAG: GDSL-type esterase/lipase family protein [Lachnospiraceae bacterium]|nr:GDSL-type esterase/lipase family protein [Lachnospiraceae bacterium]
MKSQKRKRRRRQDRLVLNLLIIVALVLVIFEGKLVMTMFTHRSTSSQTVNTDTSNTATASAGSVTESKTDNNTTATDNGNSGSLSAGSSLAGFPGNIETSPSKTASMSTVSDPDSPAIVPKAASPVDDSYFADAVFIGDSRMEGFRNASGITQGRFFTSVGMSLSSMASENIIQTADGNITVAAALSGGSYDKIYIMLGTNDLGEYDWDAFRDGFVSVTKRFQEIQPNAIIYICSVIYVEESKVSSGEYINNANVDKINSILLEICEAQGYYYLDLNEFLSNGYGALIDGASSDGVHIYPDYCKQMLDYLKSHYVTADKPADNTTADSTTDETEAGTEKSDGSV